MRKKFALLLTSLFFIAPVSVQASDISTGWYTITGTNPLYRVGAETDNIQLQYATNKANQKFQIVKLSDGLYRIGTGNSAGMQVLTVEEGDIDQIKYNRTDNQKWTITETEKGNYIIQNADKYLSYSSLKNKVLLSLSDEMSEFKIVPFKEKFTVTFIDNEETASRKSVVKGNSIEYTLPNKDGLVFEGWDVDLSNVQRNLTTNAIWKEAITHKVTFMDGDEILSDTYVEDGKEAKAPDVPVKEGKEFVGWDAEFDNITSDTVVNAIWQDKIHEHEWKPVYRIVHHEEESHEEEYEEEYTYTTYVNGYRIYESCTNDFNVLAIVESKSECLRLWDEYADNGSLNDSCYAYQTYQIPKQVTGYETKTRTVVDKEAYDEEVLDHYECECGETKDIDE